MNGDAEVHNNTLWPEPESELYRQRDCSLSVKLVPTFADRGVSRGQRGGSLLPYSLLSGPEPLLLFQVASQLYSRG
jgi:hypothetical protein